LDNYYLGLQKVNLAADPIRDGFTIKPLDLGRRQFNSEWAAKESDLL
jgi:hypothetical protein